MNIDSIYFRDIKILGVFKNKYHNLSDYGFLIKSHGKEKFLPIITMGSIDKDPFKFNGNFVDISKLNQLEIETEIESPDLIINGKLNGGFKGFVVIKNKYLILFNKDYGMVLDFKNGKISNRFNFTHVFYVIWFIHDIESYDIFGKSKIKGGFNSWGGWCDLSEDEKIERLSKMNLKTKIKLKLKDK